MSYIRQFAGQRLQRDVLLGATETAGAVYNPGIDTLGE